MNDYLDKEIDDSVIKKDLAVTSALLVNSAYLKQLVSHKEGNPNSFEDAFNEVSEKTLNEADHKRLFPPINLDILKSFG